MPEALAAHRVGSNTTARATLSCRPLTVHSYFARPSEIIDAFILPFCAFQDDQVFSWVSFDVFNFRAHLANHGHLLGESKSTLTVTVAEISDLPICFCKVDETWTSAKLAGLFAHFVYWQSFRFLHADSSFSPASRHKDRTVQLLTRTVFLKRIECALHAARLQKPLVKPLFV